MALLFIILFLHQTTTLYAIPFNARRLFIILFLHQTTTHRRYRIYRRELFIILFLHQTTTARQQNRWNLGCLSSCSYIKPQLPRHFILLFVSCLSSCSYIKPQLPVNKIDGISVVYHLVPTSNHNARYRSLITNCVVYHLVPTSNHNLPTLIDLLPLLFIILFLHQTTTGLLPCTSSVSCLSSCSYIKPQLPLLCCVPQSVVYHLVPTSNHNLEVLVFSMALLFIILFLHQTTTQPVNSMEFAKLFIILFLHQTTTMYLFFCISSVLFIILFLHQTTTQQGLLKIRQMLFIILFLHQTTTYSRKSTDNQ